MSTLAAINGIRIDHADAANDVQNIAFELIRTALKVKTLSYKLLRDPNSVSALNEQRDMLFAARQKLNDIGNYRAVHRNPQNMRMITDLYADLGALLGIDSLEINRQSLGSVQFEQPISYRQHLEFIGVTGVRTIENNRSALGGRRADKTKDGLQVVYRVSQKAQRTMVPDRLSGWVGSQEEIATRYPSGDKGHIIGRMWDGAEVHDFATESTDEWCTEEHALTFVAQDKMQPSFLNGRLNIQSFKAIDEQIHTNKAAIGRAILSHINGSTKVAMDGSIH